MITGGTLLAPHRRHAASRTGLDPSGAALAVLAALGLLLLPATARADHPVVARAVRLAEDADFAGALVVFAEAEARSDLARADLATLYVQRALVHFAQGDRDAMGVDLRRWLVLAPGDALPPSAPPPVVQAVDALRAAGVTPVRLAVQHSAAEGSLRLVATVLRDDAALVRAVRVFAAAGDAPWSEESAGELVLAVRPGQPVRYGAEAVAAGGAVVATAGSREAPRTLRVPASRRAPQGQRPARSPRAPGSEGGGFPWWLVGAGAGAVAVGVVVAVLVASPGGSDRTAVGGPTWSF